MGYIDDVFEYGKRHLIIDYAEMLTTEPEMTNAARAAGDIGATETWEFDFYISNVNPLLRDFIVSNAVTITTMTRSGGPDQPATWAEFVSFFGYAPPADAEHLKDVPWWIERDGESGVVVKIWEQYLP
jgi:Flp pilus assembly protein TadG